jgi:hypothetical protein
LDHGDLSAATAAFAAAARSSLASSWPFCLGASLGSQAEQEDVAGLQAIAPSTAMRLGAYGHEHPTSAVEYADAPLGGPSNDSPMGLDSDYGSRAGCGQMLAQASEHASCRDRTLPVKWSPEHQIGLSVYRQPFATDAQ